MEKMQCFSKSDLGQGHRNIKPTALMTMLPRQRCSGGGGVPWLGVPWPGPMLPWLLVRPFGSPSHLGHSEDLEGHSSLCFTRSALDGLSAGQKGFLCKEMEVQLLRGPQRSLSPVLMRGQALPPVSGCARGNVTEMTFGDRSVFVALSSVFSCVEAFLKFVAIYITL